MSLKSPTSTIWTSTSTLSKRHFKPRVFAQLSSEVLERYARFFRITVEELRTLPDPSVRFRLLRGSTLKY